MLDRIGLWLQGLFPLIKRGFGYLLLGIFLAGVVFLVQLGAPKAQMQKQEQTQAQVQTQSQSTNILTFNIGQYQAPISRINYDVVTYSGYAWDQDIIMGNAVRHVNALSNISQQIGTRIVPVTYGYSCYVYVLIPNLHKL